MSEPIFNAFQGLRVPSIVRTADETSLGTKDGRTLLAHLRLSLDAGDDLAWRTIFDCSRNGIGAATITALESVATADGVSFAGAVDATHTTPARIDRGGLVQREVDEVRRRLAAVAARGALDVPDSIGAFHGELPAGDDLDAARDELVGLANAYASVADLTDFLIAIALKKEEEQSIVPNVVNIMSMHKAKGLDACVVFIAAAEEEMYIREPAGRNEARRLLYVSISRAKHALIITHSITRTGAQRRLGTNPGATRRRTTFLDTRGASRVGEQTSQAYVVDPATLTA